MLREWPLPAGRLPSYIGYEKFNKTMTKEAEHEERSQYGG